MSTSAPGIDIDIAIRCFGEYSYRISDPILFYTNVCGNVSEDYTRDRLDGQLKTELLTALQPAFAKISDMGIRYSALPGHTMELAEALNEVLSGKWRCLRGLEIVSFGVSSVKASEEDEQMIKERSVMRRLWIRRERQPILSVHRLPRCNLRRRIRMQALQWRLWA